MAKLATKAPAGPASADPATQPAAPTASSKFSIEGFLGFGAVPFAGERHAAATTIDALIPLVALAEQRLAAAGHDTASVIHVLRGIFYGTAWSMDHDTEHSAMRDLAFQIYTGSLAPDDPRPLIGESLFQAIKDSAEIKEGPCLTDFGHLIIGLDSRGAASQVDIPMQGGSGEAINTWLGDLGGGAGMLAINRGKDHQSKTALKHFQGSSYGGKVNLEGDIAGVVGVQLLPGQSLADSLRAYFKPAQPADSRWNQRAQLMLTEVGGVVVNGALLNKVALIATLTEQIEEFGAFYAITRLVDMGRGAGPEDARAIGRSLVGAASEMAQIFVATLEWAMQDPKREIDATKAGCNPPESPPSDRVPMQLEGYAMTLEAGAAAGDLLARAGDALGGLAGDARDALGF
jgi:hypothetical protein